LVNSRPVTLHPLRSLRLEVDLIKVFQSVDIEAVIGATCVLE